MPLWGIMSFLKLHLSAVLLYYLRGGPQTLKALAGWYYKSLEAAIFAVAASQGVAQDLSVGESCRGTPLEPVCQPVLHIDVAHALL